VAAVTEVPLRWAVVVIDLDPARGHEQGGTRRALVVSNEAFHRSGMATVCPITTRPPRYPGEVPVPAGHAGQTKDGLILCHQVRTLDLGRVATFKVRGHVQYLADRATRAAVRSALAHQLGLDIPGKIDGAQAARE
jgi:mRNA interferase MazF